MLVYKIFEKVGENQYKNIFHKRKLTFSCGDFLIADIKMVYEAYDKNGEKRLYLSGIHVVESFELCCKYLRRFKNIENKVILECHISNNNIVRKKPKGKEGVLLTENLTIIREI